MTRLSNKQLKKLVEAVEFEGDDLTVGDLQALICDAGLCPIEHCAFYNLGDLTCPHITEVCLMLKAKG